MLTNLRFYVILKSFMKAFLENRFEEFAKIEATYYSYSMFTNHLRQTILTYHQVSEMLSCLAITARRHSLCNITTHKCIHTTAGDVTSPAWALMMSTGIKSVIRII